MIFKDKYLNSKMEKDGYLILDWIDSNSVDVLIEFCRKSGLNNVDGFSNSMNYKDSEFSKQSFRLINDVYSKSLEMYMCEIESVIGSYAVKGKGANGKISLHQDWNITDENVVPSFNIWCALDDVNFKNGCMAILVKSHHQPFSVRGSLINKIWSQSNVRDINEYWLNNYKIKYIPLKKGQALIYNQKLVHFSTENLTSKSRIAAGLIVVPKGASLIHYNFDVSNFIINKFRIDKDFFFLDNIANLNLSKFELIEKIRLDKNIDVISDQVKSSVFPDEIGLLNKLKRFYYKKINS